MALPAEKPDKPAMTAQQRRISTSSKGKLTTYKELMVGDASWGHFISFELYSLLCAGLPTAIGLGLRTLALPLLLKKNI